MQRLAAIAHLPAERDARLLTLATFVNTIGFGAILATVTLYLTRSVGMRPSEVGLGLTLGGLFGLVGGVVLGDQADRRGARRVMVAGLALEATATLSLIAVRSILALAAAMAFVAIGRAGWGSARGALIALIAEPGEGARLRTYLRAITNVGLAVGMVAAMVALAIDTRAAYVSMLVVDAATSVLCAAFVLRLHPRAPTRTAESDDGPRWVALTDKPYVAFTLAVAISDLQYFVLSPVLPLWITLHTHAPRWTVAILLLVACIVVAALQVPATRGLDGPRSAGRMVAGSGPVFCVAWALMVLASGPPAVVAVGLLLAATVIHSLGEVRQVAGAFELSFALAQDHAQGQYQGVYGLALGIADVIAPALLIFLCITWGTPGWIILGVVVTAAGWACALVERWAARHRPPAKDPPEEPVVEALVS